MLRHLIGLAPVAVWLVGCGPDYSPNTYASSAVQQANIEIYDRSIAVPA